MSKGWKLSYLLGKYSSDCSVKFIQYIHDNGNCEFYYHKLKLFMIDYLADLYNKKYYICSVYLVMVEFSRCAVQSGVCDRPSAAARSALTRGGNSEGQKETATEWPTEHPTNCDNI